MTAYVKPQMLEARRDPETGFWVREDGVIYREYRGNREGRRKGCLYPMRTYVDKNGYLFVAWRINGKNHIRKVHRLVASVFLSNPNGYETVDHIDRNRTNNSVNNLRYADRKMQSNNTISVEVSISLYGVRHCDDRKGYKKAWRKVRKLEGKRYQ